MFSNLQGGVKRIALRPSDRTKSLTRDISRDETRRLASVQHRAHDQERDYGF